MEQRSSLVQAVVQDSLFRKELRCPTIVSRPRSLTAITRTVTVAAGRFAPGHLGEWAKLTAGLSGIPVACPTAKALRDLRRRLGSTPVRALFDVLSGPLARPTTPGVRFGPYRTVSFEGCSSQNVANSDRNRAWLGRTSHHGYPMLELMTLVETGTRALLAS